MTKPAIEFPATVYKVQTLVDNGVRLTLDLPETGVDMLTPLGKLQVYGVVLLVRLEDYEDGKEQTNPRNTKKDMRSRRAWELR